MTLGDYALAVATDNCPFVPNSGQGDTDADGVGNACDVDRIDIRPRVARNWVNVLADSPLPAAILGSPDVDVSLVDVGSLAFGPGGATPVFPPFYQDVNGDGSLDLMTWYIGSGRRASRWATARPASPA